MNQVPITTIMLRRAARLLAPAPPPVTVGSFEEANELLRRWAKTAPAAEDCWDHEDLRVVVRYQDGAQWSGRYGMTTADEVSADLAATIRKGVAHVTSVRANTRGRIDEYMEANLRWTSHAVNALGAPLPAPCFLDRYLPSPLFSRAARGAEEKLYAIVTGDDVTIRDSHREAAYWHRDEWVQDPAVVPAIINAVRLAYEDPTEFRRRLGDASPARRSGDSSPKPARGPTSGGLVKLVPRGRVASDRAR